MTTSRRPLLLHVADVLRHLGVRQEIQRTVELPGLAVVASHVPDDAEIELDAALESTASGAVAVSGTVTAPWVGECRRCLRDVHGTLTTELQEVFERTPVEGETYPLVDDMVDLEPMARDAILLALPLAPLCEDGCRGPDPADFPVEPVPDPLPEDERPPDPRWAALDQLGEN